MASLLPNQVNYKVILMILEYIFIDVDVSFCSWRNLRRPRLIRRNECQRAAGLQQG